MKAFKDLESIVDHLDTKKQPKIELSESDRRDLAAVLQLENEKRAHAANKGKAPTDAELLKITALKEIEIWAKDAPESKLSLPPELGAGHGEAQYVALRFAVGAENVI